VRNVNNALWRLLQLDATRLSGHATHSGENQAQGRTVHVPPTCYQIVRAAARSVRVHPTLVRLCAAIEETPANGAAVVILLSPEHFIETSASDRLQR
jgi:hypothetical protein